MKNVFQLKLLFVMGLPQPLCEHVLYIFLPHIAILFLNCLCIGLICWHVVCAMCDLLNLLIMLNCTCMLSSLSRCFVSIQLLRTLMFALHSAYKLTRLHGAGMTLAKHWVAPSGVSE